MHRRRQPTFDIDRLIIEVPDPAASADWLGTALGLPINNADKPTAPLGVCDVVFAPGPANRVTSVVLTGPAAPDVTIGGLRYQAGPGTR